MALNDIPDWARYMSPAELEREAMDYELAAEYDRWDGHREDLLGLDADGDYPEFDPDGRELYWPYLLNRRPRTETIHDDSVPF